MTSIFKEYFSKKPHIIRGHRNGVAVLKKTTTKKEVQDLLFDITSYFGMGCRNVSKIYFEEGFDLDIFKNIQVPFDCLTKNNSYLNNYQYQQTIALMNQTPIIDLGYLILKQEQPIDAPIGVVHYTFFKNLHQVEKEIATKGAQIQCVVSNCVFKETSTSTIGKAQHPSISDYADNINVLDFLSALE